jgi:hypothetical protein
MGASESVIRNSDKRSSRREHRSAFQSAITRYRAQNPGTPKRCSAWSCASNARQQAQLFNEQHRLHIHQLLCEPAAPVLITESEQETVAVDINRSHTTFAAHAIRLSSAAGTDCKQAGAQTRRSESLRA